MSRLTGGFFFSQPIDFVSHSRGGLAGKWLVLKNSVPVRKGALVACANGVGYFTAGWHVAKLLSAAKMLLSA